MKNTISLKRPSFSSVLRVSGVLVAAAAVASLPVPAHAQFFSIHANIGLNSAPPPPRYEAPPPQPGPNYIWVQGYWGQRDGRYVWVPGTWQHRPHDHAVWVAPRWEHRDGHYVFVKGYWR